MYALQKVAIKMVPHIMANPATIPFAVALGVAALIYDANN